MGQGAKIFLLSLLISACIFGLVSFVIVSSVKDSAQPSSAAEVRTSLPDSAYGESFSLLAVFTEDNGTFLSGTLVRVDRERAELTFTPIFPKTTVNGTDLSSMLSSGGISSLLRGVYFLTGIEPDFYAVASESELAQAVNDIGNVRYTFESSMTVGNVLFEAGSTTLSGDMARALVRYDTEHSFREENAAYLVRGIFERLASPDGESAYAKICERITTTFSKSEFASRKGLISSYSQMKKTMLFICGSHKGAGDARYFVTDVEATLDLFAKYRKYYN